MRDTKMTAEATKTKPTNCLFKLKTNLLIASIAILGIYMMLFEGQEEINIDDYIDFKSLEEDVDSANPVHHMEYVSPINRSLFEDWGVAVDSWHAEHQINCREKNATRYIHYKKLWHRANRLISRDSLYPADSALTSAILEGLRSACIVKTEVLEIGKYESGTGEKWLITLEGDQQAIVKIVWELKGEIKKGGLCNTGFELATSEIAAFHLHDIIGFRNTPYVTGRQIHLMNEILPTATDQVAKRILKKADGQLCVVGTCYDCQSTRHICPENNIIEASLTFWVPRTLKLHTYPELYMPFSIPRIDKWRNISLGNRSYCDAVQQTIEPYHLQQFYLDLFDFSVVDTLMYHYDSKHYTIDDVSVASGSTVRLDHGRAFCTYDREDDDVFMAPLKQCCTLRSKTYTKLAKLQGGRLSEKLRAALSSDPISPILKPGWFSVLDQRLKRIFETLEACFNKFGVNDVLVVDT